MLSAGAASRDVTPALRGDFFGYVRPDLRARGAAGRLWAHALVLDDGTSRVCLLTLDLGAPLVTTGVLERVADLGFGLHNCIVAATHTHAGPSRPGAWVAQQAAAAVRDADATRRPARAAWSSARLDDASRNRSLEAHLANHGLDLAPGTGTADLDPEGPDHARDVTLRLLRVEDLYGRPLASWAHFSAHPTTIGPANVHFCADYPGAATHHFRRGFQAPPVAILTNGTEGDLVPRDDEVSQHALADRIGQRVAEAMRRAWDEAGPTTRDLALAGATQRITYAGQEVAPGARVGTRAWFGLPFLGGAQNGPSFFHRLGLEGRRRPHWLAGPVQGRKLVAAPAPWPPVADVTVLRVGDRLLLSVPGEPTVEAGRRMRAAALGTAGTGVSDALVVGLAQGYRGYFTTPREYDQQHYEGGHTVFGRHTSRLVESAHVELAGRVTAGGPAPGAPRDATADAAPPPAVGLARVPAPVGRGVARPRVLGQPPPVVARFETVRVSWTAPRRGRGRPVGRPYLVLERRVGVGAWQPVDDDRGVGTVWRQRGRRVTARYEVPGDLAPGRYRFVVQAPVRPVATDAFEVVPSAGLVPLRVLADGDSLRFEARNPCPDPAQLLRRRERRPRGGQVRFTTPAGPGVAHWDAAAVGWRAAVAGAPDVVEVPAGGLVDAHGNRSGPAVRLLVDAPGREDWPASLGPGGGRAPGLFGLGPVGAPTRH